MSEISSKQAIRWTSDYAVGVQEIDQEHQGLFGIAEKLRSAIQARRGPEALESLLTELVDYTCYHFANEERLMERIGYPYAQDHLRQHEELRSSVRTMKERMSSGEPSVAGDVMYLLVAWLRCHTTTSDRRIGSYMRKLGLVS